MVVSSLTPDLAGLTKSGSERPFVPLYLPQLSPLVELDPTWTNVSKGDPVEAVQRLLDRSSRTGRCCKTQQASRDLMEVVYWHAAEWLLAELPMPSSARVFSSSGESHGRLSQAYGDGCLAH